MEMVWLVLVLVSGAGIIGAMFRWLTGKRDPGSIFAPKAGTTWIPPSIPEDEWEKWGKN